MFGLITYAIRSFTKIDLGERASEKMVSSALLIFICVTGMSQLLGYTQMINVKGLSLLLGYTHVI